MRRGSAGFTLLEMVVSLTILAGMAAFLVVAFRLAGSSIERGEAETKEMARLRAGISIFERSIRSADPSVLTVEDESIPYFFGESKKLRFLSSSSVSSVPGGGFRLLCFFEAERGEGDTGMSVADASPFRADGIESWDGTEGARVFLPGATDVTFSYSPGPLEDGTWEWFETWDIRETEVLPRAVRVTFTTQSESGPLENAFVVPLRESRRDRTACRALGPAPSRDPGDVLRLLDADGGDGLAQRAGGGTRLLPGPHGR
jgi:prepilin-type N-terminal cleavage/methylation domain-containing protein